MSRVAAAEWDTLLFFYGVILCVGGLSQFGYLSLVSHQMYVNLGPTWANSLVGVLSAVVDNIPVMFAVLTMDPTMSHGQWLLVTLTAGVGRITSYNVCYTKLLRNLDGYQVKTMIRKTQLKMLAETWILFVMSYNFV